MKHAVLLYSFLLFSFCLRAQPPLERIVTLKASNENIASVLNKISVQTGITFSYSPTQIPVDKKVSFSVQRKPVRTVLQLLFGSDVTFKEKKNFIILTARPVSKAPAKTITISGYVYDAKGTQVASASVLSKTEHLSAVTNDYGYYKMDVPADKFPVELKVEKANYPDTTLKVESGETSTDVALPVQEKTDTIVVSEQHDSTVTEMPAAKDTSAIKTFFGRFLLSDETKANIRNISDTLFTKTNISLVPYVSTNSLLSGNTVNDVSINILAGYSKGINKFEIGGLVNVDREDVKHFQVAGLVNAVGGNVQGWQIAGWANMDAGSVNGVRIAGLVNMGHHLQGVQLAGIGNLNANYFGAFARLRSIVNDTVTGVEIGGLFNINAGYVKGVKVAGIVNAGNTTDGAQVAGIVNSNFGNAHGIMLAGLLNTSVDTADGLQVAGILNVNTALWSKGGSIAGIANLSGADVNGAQIAAIMNTARFIKGVQVAALFNYAHQVKGTQIALINYTDSIDGTSIGLLNFVKKGYHRIELYGDEVIYTQLAFRTGLPRFHNIFTAGVDLTSRYDGLWCFGYGLGTLFPVNENWKFCMDLTSQMLLMKGGLEQAANLNSLFFGVERSFSKRFSLAVGPAYRVMIQQNDTETGIGQLVPYSFYDHTYANGNSLQMWVGGKVSLKFL